MVTKTKGGSSKGRISATVPRVTKEQVVEAVESGDYASESELTTLAITEHLAKRDLMAKYSEVKTEIEELKIIVRELKRKVEENNNQKR